MLRAKVSATTVSALFNSAGTSARERSANGEAGVNAAGGDEARVCGAVHGQSEAALEARVRRQHSVEGDGERKREAAEWGRAGSQRRSEDGLFYVHLYDWRTAVHLVRQRSSHEPESVLIGRGQRPAILRCMLNATASSTCTHYTFTLVRK